MYLVHGHIKFINIFARGKNETGKGMSRDDFVTNRGAKSSVLSDSETVHDTAEVTINH